MHKRHMRSNFHDTSSKPDLCPNIAGAPSVVRLLNLQTLNYVVSKINLPFERYYPLVVASSAAFIKNSSLMPSFAKYRANINN